MARTFDDIYDKLDDLINVIGGSTTRGGIGSSRSYRRTDIDISDVNNLDELIKRYETLEELEIDRYERLESQAKKYEEWLENNRAGIDAIIQKKQSGSALTEDEIELYDKATEAAQRLGDAKGKLSDTNRVTAYVNSVERSINKVTGLVKSMYSEVKTLTDSWAKVDHAASKYAKTIGLSKKGMDELRHNSLTASTKNNIGSWFNMTAEELIQAQTDYTQKVGHSIRMSSEDLTNMAAMKAVMGDRGNELAVLYENFGVSMTTTAKHAGKMFADASKAGISFEKYSDNVAKNIKIAQNYTFKNGLKGLESMAKKATAIKLDMQQVAAFADKVSTVEGAIDVSAKLQVLGGPFAQLADPLGMLNEGLTDMEGLQDRLVKMVGNLGSFDKATGEVKVSAFDKQRIKVAAEAMGVSYDNILETVNAKARRNEISNQISASSKASGLNEEMQELIKNVGTFKDGKAGVTINGEFKTLDQLRNKDYEQLLIETRSESEDIKDIAKNVRSLVDAREGLGKQIENIKSRMFSWVGLTEKGGAKLLGSNFFKPFLYAGLGAFGVLKAGKIVSMLSQLPKAIKGLFSTIVRGFSSTASGSANAISNMLGNLFSGKANGSSNSIFKNIISSFKGKGATVNVVDDIVQNVATNSVDDVARVATRKGSGKILSKIVTKNGTQIVKGGTSRTLKRAAITTLGKSGVQTIGKIGAQVGTNLAASSWAGPLGLIGGIASAAGDIAIDRAIANGKMKKGGVGHHFAKAGTGALGGAAMGASIGMFLGPIGAAIGATIGAVGGAISGLVKAGKAKQERILDEKLGGLGIERKGDYSRKKLKEVNKALERGDGKISEKVRKKLKKNGDYELLDKLDEDRIKRNEKEALLLESERKLKEAKKGKKVSEIKKKIENANIFVNNATFGGDGLKKLKRNHKKSINTINKLNAFDKQRLRAKEMSEGSEISFKAIAEKGNGGSWETVKENSFNRQDVNNQRNKDYNININGSLKLTGDNGQSIDIISEIRNKPHLLDELTRLIAKNIERLENGVTGSGF